MKTMREFFVRVQFPKPDARGRKGASAIVGAKSVQRAREIALIGYPGSTILDIWERAD